MQKVIGIAYFMSLSSWHSFAIIAQEGKSLSDQIRAAVSSDTTEKSDQFRELQAKARMGNTQAMLEVSVCLRKGLGVSQDLRLAHIACLRAAEHGEEVGMYEAAIDFLEGRGVEKDTALGIHWLTKASELNCLAAIERLVQIQMERYMRQSRWGEHVLKWSKRGADLDSVLCLKYLGECHYFGIGTEVDDSKAFQLFEQSSNRGNVHATIMLAVCYAYGRGTETNVGKSLHLFRKAAAGNDPHAIHAFATALDELVIGSEEIQDGWDPIGLSAKKGKPKLCDAYKRRVVELLEQAVNLGRLEATPHLARKLATGEGCTQDPERAFALATAASQEGVVEATTVLGDCYMEGLGVKPNSKKGASLYLKAAKAGSPEAQYKYAMCLATGNGVRVNDVECRQWMSASAARGHVYAEEFMQQVRQHDLAQVRSWLDSMVSSNWVNDAMSARRDEAFAEEARLSSVMQERERISH